MQPSSYSDNIRRLRELDRFTGDSDAAAALSEAVGALAQLLDAESRRTLAASLPSEVAQGLRFDPQTAREATSVPELSNLAHARVVCRAFGDPHDESKRLPACGLQQEREARRPRPGWRRLLSSR